MRIATYSCSYSQIFYRSIVSAIWHLCHKPITIFCVVFLGLGLTGCATPPPAKPTNKPPPRHVEPIPRGGIYQVISGDNLYSIATRFGLDFRQVGDWNGIPPPYQINVGQILRLAKSNMPRRRVQEPFVPLIPSRVVRRKPLIPPNPYPKRTPRRRPLPSDHTANHWIWPTKGQVIQTFIKGNRTRHGIHIAGTFGQNVVAAASGRVIYSGAGLRNCGSLIIIKHSRNYLSAYDCNSKLLVQDKSHVTQGMKIAKMGRATNGKPILHFEIRRREKVLDPMRLLPAH